MIYSNACSYAIRAMTRLALLRPNGYVLLEELCDQSDLPRHFVAKIFQDLVRRRLLISAKGRGGGFALARPPAEITLYDIVAEIDGVDALRKCVIGMASCDDHQPCPQHDQWTPIRRQLKDYFQRTTLEQMAETLQRKLELIGEPLPSLTPPSKPARHE